jgi:hypothetical protein
MKATKSTKFYSIRMSEHFASFVIFFEKYAAGGVSVSSSRISCLRHSSMERWNPDRHGCFRTHPAILDAGSANESLRGSRNVLTTKESTMPS